MSVNQGVHPPQENGGLIIPRIIASTSGLVNRQEQINKFRDALKRIIRQQPLPSNLFEWHGGPGIGKSTLVALLLHECQTLGVPAAVLNFKHIPPGRIDQYLVDPSYLIEDIVADLQANLPPNFELKINRTALQEEIQKYRTEVQQAEIEQVVAKYFEIVREERLLRRHEWITALQYVVVEFTHIVGLLKHGNERGTQPVVLFLDETEYIDSALADWIEEWLIMPLAQIKHCVVIWTGRRPWRWRRPEIRRRLDSELLQVFESDSVKAQLAANSPAHPELAEMLFRNVHGVTGGHPFASRVAITQLNDWEDEGKQLDDAHFPDYEPELLTRIYDTFLKGYAFSGRDFDGELVRACELMTMVRLFDTTMLSAVLHACDDRGQFNEWNQEDFGYLLQRLKRTQLLIWNKGYAIDPALRHIAQRYFAVCDRETYLIANRAALAVYQRWLDRPVDNRGLFVVEELYHLAALRQASESIDLVNEFRGRLSNYRKDWIHDPDARRNALERLEGELESDTELKRVTNGESNSILVELVRDEIRRIPEIKRFSVLS